MAGLLDGILDGGGDAGAPASRAWAGLLDHLFERGIVPTEAAAKRMLKSGMEASDKRPDLGFIGDAGASAYDAARGLVGEVPTPSRAALMHAGTAVAAPLLASGASFGALAPLPAAGRMSAIDARIGAPELPVPDEQATSGFKPGMAQPEAGLAGASGSVAGPGLIDRLRALFPADNAKTDQFAGQAPGVAPALGATAGAAATPQPPAGGYTRASQDVPDAAFGADPKAAAAALPANAAPAIGATAAGMPSPTAAASAPPAATQPAIPETSLFGRLGGNVESWLGRNRMTLAALGSGLAGAQTIGQGLNRAGPALLPAIRADIAQHQQNQTAQALIKRGLPEDVALAASQNPAILSQILPQIFGPKQSKYTQIGEDMLGNKKFGFVDEVNKTITIPGPGGSATVPMNAAGQPLQGPELLAHLEKTDPMTAAGVKSLLEGNMSGTGRNIQKLMPVASLVDPSFDQTQYPVRLATRKNYTSGKQFQELQALNTVAGHLDDLSKSADELKNTRFPWWNQVGNAALQLTGDARVDNFNTVKQAVTNELSKAYRGGHVTEGDVREWQSNISSAKSPEQLRGVVGKMNDLLMSKRQALEDGYRSSMGNAPLPSEFSSVSDKARKTFDRVSNWAHGTQTPETAAPARQQQQPEEAPLAAVNPKTGQRIVFRGGRWVDVQSGQPVQ